MSLDISQQTASPAQQDSTQAVQGGQEAGTKGTVPGLEPTALLR